MLESSVYEHLVCPDCKGKLVKTSEDLTCNHCKRCFIESCDTIIDLLPVNISKPDLAEENFWHNNKKEGIKAFPLLALVHKGDVLLHFYDQVLPNLELHGKVLEIGSGSGWLSSLIKLAFPNICVFSTDVSHSALIKGQQTSHFLHAKIDRSVTCKIERLPFEDNFFDFVIGSAVLHRTLPERSLPEIYRVLKIGGSYLGIGELAIPSALGIVKSKISIPGRREKGVGVRKSSYSYHEWYNFFVNAGFKDIDLQLERDPNYKHYNWFTNWYYETTANFPEWFVKQFLACSMGMTAKKL